MNELPATQYPDRLTPTQAAAYLGISHNTIRVWAKTGKLAHIKIGWLYFFNKADLDKKIKVNPENANIFESIK